MAEKILHYLTGCFLLFLLIGCNTAPKSVPVAEPAPPVCVLERADGYKLQGYVQLLPDTATGYSIGQILEPRLQNSFVPFPRKDFALQTRQAYWGKIQLENRLPDADMHSEWVLYFSTTFTRVTLFTKLKNGDWASELNGSFVPAHEKGFVPTRVGNLYKLSLPPGEVVTLYFRGEGERESMPPTFQVYLTPLALYYDQLVAAKTWSTLFFGFLLMMFLYNLLKWFIVRDRSYIYYSGYLLMVLVYTLYSTDNLEDWIGNLVFVEHPAWFALFKISLHLGLMCYLSFIRSFLDLEHLLPRWDRFFRYLIWLGIPMMALFVFTALWYNFSYVIDDRLILFYIALVTLSGLFFMYPLFRTKDPKGFFITAGIGVINLAFLLTLYSRMTQTPFTVFYLKVGVIVEILIFSMGLAYRQRQQELARQQADFALRESRLIQEKKQLEADRLQELNDFKSRFFTNITHEFRTPLTVMLGMTERLSADAGHLTETDAKGKLNLIRRSGENLLRLVNQILDLAKLESNTLKIHYIQGDVFTFIKYVTESMHSLANAHNLLLRVESAQNNIVMDYDPERLLQVIYNLLSNAIKFTPSGGKVLLRVDREDAWLHLSVTDSGAGIPAEELPHLFERFFQARNQEHAKAGGTGIGLSLTRELVRAMGGDISVESTVGQGSTFHVRLPITNNSVFDEKWRQPGAESWKTLLPETHTAGTLAQDAPADDPSLPRILLIEDNPDVLEYLSACLRGAFALDFAYNGQAGIEKALETVPDLIVSDVMMPVKDGFEVVETLKNDERSSHIPVILLTARADVQSRLAGLRRGADAYLSKPFHQEELQVTVENLLETRRKLQSKYQQHILAAETPADNPQADPENSFLQKVRAIVDAHYSEDDFGLPQLCQKIGMSRSQLFRKMKALTDIAPSDLIRTHRLNKAKVLLESGAANVNEAAWEVGFKDPSYFSKLYQEAFGEAPSATRK